MSDFLNVQGLFAGYGEKEILHHIDFSVKKGTVLGLIGPNGGGKSTLLKVLSRELAPKKGNILLDGRELTAIPAKELAQRSAVVLTNRVSPELMTCFEVAAMGRYPYTGWFGRLQGSDRAIVTDALQKVDALSLSARQFSELSDGQQQRILLARAIAQQPELLLLDEPTSFLDIRYKLEFLSTLQTLSKEDGVTVIMSLHEPELAIRFCDELLCLKDGKIFAEGDSKIISRATLEKLYDLLPGQLSSEYTIDKTALSGGEKGRRI